MKCLWIQLVLCLLCLPIMLLGQIRLSGNVFDARDKNVLTYVNIGIKQKNLGTVSSESGFFSIKIPKENLNDTLSFSMIGYENYDIPILKLRLDSPNQIEMVPKNKQLEDVIVASPKLEPRSYGIKHRGLLIHFSDGMFNQNDIFEIGQLIKLGNSPVKVTSLNLYILNPRKDSAKFRINFYSSNDGKPGKKIVNKNIVQRKAIEKGWLKFDLTKENIWLSGDFIATIEFIPDFKKGQVPVNYEVKLGGNSRSFYRQSSLGVWNTPPHHYCMNISALANIDAPSPIDDDVESVPAFTLYSQSVRDSFSIFIQLPKDYLQDTLKRHAVLFQLDGNAYFDQINSACSTISKKRKWKTSPIIVGIGYKNAYIMDSLRVRDYTFPKAMPEDSFPTSGGAELFYTFLKYELIPYIDRTYRTDTSSRTIMGHSFGGYFVLYALLHDFKLNVNEHGTFNYYVSASPSLNYFEGYIVKEFSDLINTKTTKYNKLKKLFFYNGGP